MQPIRFLLPVIFLLPCLAHAERKKAPIREDIPFLENLAPKMEEPVFAVCSKQGMRILVSRDDGKEWEQVFLGTDHPEDGGYHGNFAVYGMAYAGGVIGAFSGWGADGVYIGSEDGVNWGHLNEKGAKLNSVWDAAGGDGVILTSADQWRGMMTSEKGFLDWEAHSVKEFLDGGKTQHMICAHGDFDGGRFVIIGDFGHVFVSENGGRSWKHFRLPEEAGPKQDALAFGNGVFVCSFPEHVARSTDGGETWTIHPHGLNGRLAWRGLSFVKGEFWLTAGGGRTGRKSKDGITWEDLPKGTPAGTFVEGDTGTLINVDRNRNTIQRSEDGKKWETVHTTDGKGPNQSFAFAVYGKVNKVAK